MTAAAGTKKAQILTFLEGCSGLTAPDIGRALGFRSLRWVSVLLQDMQRAGLVAADREFRAQQGRQVSVWRLATAGTPPLPVPPASPGNAERHRARRRGPVLPAVPAAARPA